MVSSWGYNSGSLPEIELSTLLIAVMSPSAVNPASVSSSSHLPFWLISLLKASDSLMHKLTAYGAISSSKISTIFLRALTNSSKSI